MKFLGRDQGFRKLEHGQDRQTDVTERITITAFLDGN